MHTHTQSHTYSKPLPLSLPPLLPNIPVRGCAFLHACKILLVHFPNEICPNGQTLFSFLLDPATWWA